MLQPDEIIRSSRKTLSISVDAHGRLIVRAPARYAEDRIFAFIESKASWIEKQKARALATKIPLPPDDLQGYELPLLGSSAKILLTEGGRVRYDPVKGTLYLPKDKPKERLRQWIKKNARLLFTETTERLARTMGARYLSVSVGSAKTRWGSCTAKNAIRYTFRLFYCPKEVVEYVVVHELAHVKHKNHSKAFWREVERYIPDWKARRAYLKAHAAYMEIL